MTSDPLDPWVKGAATLYTQEFFDVVKEHLNPGGVVTLFVQLYESNTAAVKSEIGTFFKAFPNGVVWGNTNNGQGYDLVLMGQVEPIKIDVDAMRGEARRARSTRRSRSRSARSAFNSAIELFSTYAGHADGSRAVARRTRRSTATATCGCSTWPGMGLNLYQSGPIYAEMLQYAQLSGEPVHRLASDAAGAARRHSSARTGR